jgi:hypothetical protein
METGSRQVLNPAKVFGSELTFGYVFIKTPVGCDHPCAENNRKDQIEAMVRAAPGLNREFEGRVHQQLKGVLLQWENIYRGTDLLRLSFGDLSPSHLLAKNAVDFEREKVRDVHYMGCIE